ncbi:type I restriction endonuclease subunit R [bacterium]|nr:type I restriction endonuclease subunit R [bacterium]
MNGKPDMREAHISQIPAIKLLINLDYKFLTQAETFIERKEKSSNVILENILEKKLRQLNKINYKDDTYDFSNANINAAINAIKNVREEGLIKTNETVYDLLLLGKSFEENIQGNIRSFTIKYIDWENISNNDFHIAAEYEIEKNDNKGHRRPDIILFVNGIPFSIIECKNTETDISQAISQHLRNQNNENIPKLYYYSQILLAMNKNNVKYGTTGTEERYWSVWKDKISEDKLENLVNKKLADDVKEKLFSDDFKYVKGYYDKTDEMQRQITSQDKAIYSLLEPSRLLELTRNFVVYDLGIKKIARYQQYFAVKKTLERIREFDGNKRKGGVIWHTQGSGKSLTMVMLAKSLALDADIQNPRVIIVTDRTNLDKQIKKTFFSCGMEPVRARSGEHLLQMIEENKRSIITTVINKFHAALNKREYIENDKNIFVLVDESHRSQYGEFNVMMQKIMPNACYIGFTGTPLMKNEKNTAMKFGGFIHKYTIDQAVRDKAVVPLLYEARHALKNVQKDPIDLWFDRVCENLSIEQKADLKRKFARIEKINQSDQVIKLIAYDISYHYKNNWQGTGFKAQLATKSKIEAIKFKNFLDEIGMITSEVVISAPDTREGYDKVDPDTNDMVIKFWKNMMERFGNEEKYNNDIIDAFKTENRDPELIIVVDKLLTGFDAPRNTILYLVKQLKEHNLLQAIARVNRIFEGKDYGYIVDYQGLLGELDQALTTYSALEKFEETDLEGAIYNIEKEINNLPQRHSDLWAVFKEIQNKYDEEEYEKLLFDKEKRDNFYRRLSDYSRCLSIALSSVKFFNKTSKKLIKKYKDDLKFFQKLRIAVKRRYAESIDNKEYERKIQKLLDTYITSEKIITLVNPINIMDKEKFKIEVEKVTNKTSKADMIAHMAKKIAQEKKEEDPVFYEKFSKLIEDVINQYRQKRIDEAEYLKRANELYDNVIERKDPNMPTVLEKEDVAKAFYGIVNKILMEKGLNIEKEKVAKIAIDINKLIEKNIVVDWYMKIDIQNRMKNDIEDYLLDTMKINIDFDTLDKILENVIHIAKKRYVY